MKTYRYFLLFLFILIPLTSVFADDFTIQPDESLSFDTQIVSSNPSSNYGNSTTLGIGENNTAVSIRRSLIKFDLSSIPSNAIISSVNFSLWIQADYSSNSSTVSCYGTSRSWVESQATWDVWATGNNWNGAGMTSTADYSTGDLLFTASLGASESVNSEVIFTSYISEFTKYIDGTETNNGFMCRTDEQNNDLYLYHSSSATTSTYRPKLQVTYTLPNTPTATFTYTSTPSSTPTNTITYTPSNTPTITFTPEFTFTPSLTPEITFTPSNTPTYTFTPPSTFTDTPTVTVVPTITNTPTPTGFPDDIGLPYFLLLVLPLLFIDWQVAVIWAVVSIVPDVVIFLQSLPFQGLEVWFLFLVVGFLRLIFFRNR